MKTYRKSNKQLFSLWVATQLPKLGLNNIYFHQIFQHLYNFFIEEIQDLTVSNAYI